MYNVVLQALSPEKCPVRGVVIDVIDYQGVGYAYRLSRDNLTQFSDSQIESIVGWLKSRCDFATKISGKTVTLEKGE